MHVTRCISSDTHVIEPPTLWQQRIDAEYRSRAPLVVEQDDADWWFVDGGRFLSFSGGDQTGKRFDEPEKLRTGARFRNVRRGAYLPGEHLKDNEIDGVTSTSQATPSVPTCFAASRMTPSAFRKGTPSVSVA
jgi:hypothetical protein